MKKIASIILLVFAFTFTVQAQKKVGKDKVEKLIRKMTTELNLSSNQQEKLKPLLVEQAADRKLMKQKRDEFKKTGEKITKEDKKKMKVERVAKEKLMTSKVENILDKNQFEKYKVLQEKMKSKMKKKKKNKKNNQ